MPAPIVSEPDSDWHAGFSAVGLVAVPAILMHANYITVGAMLIEICAAASIGAMVAVYDYASQESMY